MEIEDSWEMGFMKGDRGNWKFFGEEKLVGEWEKSEYFKMVEFF